MADKFRALLATKEGPGKALPDADLMDVESPWQWSTLQ
jgi:hypothetical protein